MPLTAGQLDLLSRRAKLAGGTPVVKVLARPWHTLISKAIERRCVARGTSAPKVAKTFWGGTMHVVIPDRVSLSIFRYGYFEDDLTRVFSDTLQAGMTFFDVGSHFGYFSLLAAHLVGPSGRVHAFEPTPSTYEVVRKNLHGIPNARANNVAVWSEDATMEFSDFGVEFSAFNTLRDSRLTASESMRAKATRVSVRARSIDSYIAETGVVPDFLKIDTEGAELHVLHGMRQLLTNRRPALTLEVGDVGNAAGQRESRCLVDHMLAMGYEALEHDGTSLVPHIPRERYDYGNIFFRPRA